MLKSFLMKFDQICKACRKLEKCRLCFAVGEITIMIMRTCKLGVCVGSNLPCGKYLQGEDACCLLYLGWLYVRCQNTTKCQPFSDGFIITDMMNEATNAVVHSIYNRKANRCNHGWNTSIP